MPPNLPPPPNRPTLTGIERTGSPVTQDEQPVGPQDGFQLTVYGLDRTSPQSAADHLRRLLVKTKDLMEPGPWREAIFGSLVVRQADTRNCLDYAYLALDPDRVPIPRPDILQELRNGLLQAEPSLTISWRANQNVDRSRRMTFAMNSEQHAKETMPKLDAHFASRNIAVLSRYASRPTGSWRVTYDLVRPADVEAVVASPPVIEHHMHYPSRPRLITPLYGFEIAILGCRDWYGAKTTLDRWVRARCSRTDGQDPIAHSRMELNGEVYTAVLTTWEDTLNAANGEKHLARWLTDDAAGKYVRVSGVVPGLLYGLNSQGLFVNSNTSDGSMSSREAADVRRSGLEALTTVYSAVQQTNNAVLALGSRIDSQSHSLHTLFAMQNTTSRVTRIRQDIADLRQECHQAEMMLLQNIPDDLKQRNLARTREIAEEIQQRRQELRNAEQDEAAISFSVTSSLEAASSSHSATATAQLAAPPGLPVPPPAAFAGVPPPGPAPSTA
ncbi:hypothetical protein PsYK624_167760 [Phanerochaete sordida]|uniref:Uncharacterized protein n=1 Tax=Phanerochaete sordida TaxID=48140 RepID=A0A9P3GRF3_9APHY|nr:hypothetical protein PsYK624_167760 [Phanerochaete sordida]